MTSGLPRITILTANAGGGHRAAARSLSEALDGRADVSCLSLMDDHTPFPISTWSSVYGPMVTHFPWAYHLVYRYGASRQRVVLAARMAYSWVHGRVSKALAGQDADLVISVHPLQTDVAVWALAQQGQHTPFVTVVTDPVTPPRAWFCPEVDLCIVATEPARRVALQCGLPAERLRVIGLPLRRAFRDIAGRSRPQARAALGLAPELPLVLLSGGGAGIGRQEVVARAMAKRLAMEQVPAQLAIVAGTNRELRRRCAAGPWPLPVTVLGFVEEMADWLAAADLLVTKAGPATLAEAACLGVPVLITDFVPGQESGNIAWVRQNGAGLFESDPVRIAGLVAELLRPGNPCLAQMAGAARAMAHPTASAEIADAVLRIVAPTRVL